MAHHPNEHQQHASFSHPVSMRLLYIVFFSLVGLTIFTVVANGWPLGKFDIWVAMIIATVKASLVVLFFMHMYWEKGFNAIAFFSSFLFVMLFIGLTLMDRENYRENSENFPISSRPAESSYVSPADATE